MAFLFMGAAAFFVAGANAACVALDLALGRRLPGGNAFWCVANVATGTLALCLSQ